MLTATLTFSVHVACFFVLWHCQRPFFFCLLALPEAFFLLFSGIARAGVWHGMTRACVHYCPGTDATRCCFPFGHFRWINKKPADSNLKELWQSLTQCLTWHREELYHLPSGYLWRIASQSQWWRSSWWRQIKPQLLSLLASLAFALVFCSLLFAKMRRNCVILHTPFFYPQPFFLSWVVPFIFV